MVLESAQPSRDRVALASAERQTKEIARQTGWTAAGPIALRVYPDVETFRNATGEPGWARARPAYAAAVQRVAGLVQRNGVAAVLDWLRSGLPAGESVTN